MIYKPKFYKKKSYMLTIPGKSKKVKIPAMLVTRPSMNKGKAKQTGKTTVKLDKKRTAMKPGWRISAMGNKYYEARRNRSDRSRKRRL